MKAYDVIALGTGSAMNIVSPLIERKPDVRVAVIDKDDPGGICLTRGCIPSKILLYPAEVIREIQRAETFGIDVDIKNVDFRKVMDRMRAIIYGDIDQTRYGLSHSGNIDYYANPAEFVAPYTMKVDGETIKSDMILLGAGSKVIVPPIKGLEQVGYHTSDTILKISELPPSIAVVGGGYIAAEYGHFLAAMGAQVTIIGRNPQFLPQEEPEVSALAKRELGKHMTILTNHQVQEAKRKLRGKKELSVVNRESGKMVKVKADEIVIASGRGPNADVLRPDRGGVRTDEKGWILVDEYLETSQPNVWAFGDAIGRHMFKHVGNYESAVVYYNAVLKRKVKVDYHAVPHAVFTHPEIASVGLREAEAIGKYGEDNVLVGVYRFEDTAKGEAMAVKDYFVKVVVERGTMQILGAHVIGPHASILIQEVINLMYTSDRSARPILDGMHIHPSLSEVVDRAFSSLRPAAHYRHHH